ncbi:hypothetical protein ACP3TG_29065 [Phytobacter diazotrophicus]
MAAINVKISDALKEKGDEVLRAHDLSATQYISFCWQYLAEHGKPPFHIETRLFTASDLVMTIIDQMEDARTRLRKIMASGNTNEMKAEEFAMEKQVLSRLAGEIQLNGSRLESTPDDKPGIRTVRTPLTAAWFNLTSCTFILSGMDEFDADADPGTELAEQYMALVNYSTLFEDKLILIRNLLLDAGLIQGPEPVRKIVIRGDNVTVTLVQPQDYHHGAWQVRLEARKENIGILEDMAVAFPALKGRVFVPGTVYGKAVYNSLTQDAVLGFRFLNGVSEFHMYTSGHAEEENPTTPDMLAAALSAAVDAEVRALQGQAELRALATK